MATTSNICGSCHIKHFHHFNSFNAPILSRAQYLADNGFLDSRVCRVGDAALQPEIFTSPRIYSAPIDIRGTRCSFVKYFNHASVKQFLLSRGADVEHVDCHTIMSHPTLRRAMDHLYILSALTSEYEDPDPKAFVVRMPNRISNIVEPPKDKLSSYEAYDSDFRITFTAPYSKEPYASGASPSFYQLFIAVAHAVQGVIVQHKNETDITPLERACIHYNLFTGQSNSCLDVVLDILEDYKALGHLELVDSIDPNPQTLEDAVKLVVSVKNTSLPPLGSLAPHLGVSFSPGGLLYPSFLGFNEYLTEMNVINVTTPLSGSSAGAITAITSLIYTANRYHYAFLTDVFFSHLVEKKYVGSLDKLVSIALNRFFLPGTYAAANERIGTLQFNTGARDGWSMENRHVTSFKNNDDMLTSVLSSSNVPGFTKIGPVKLRGEECYDGLCGVNPYFIGSSKTAGKRTVRFIPIPLGHGRKIKTNMNNDVANGFLQMKDKYFVHLIRLKSLFRQLLIRRLSHEQSGSMHEWKTEVEKCINVYNILAKGTDAIKSSSNEIDEWLMLLSVVPGDANAASGNKDCKLTKLFELVVASEMSLSLGRDSKVHAAAIKSDLTGKNILLTYASPRYPNKLSDVKFLSTPYTLLDWLEHELELLNMPMEEPVYDKAQREIILLKALLHNLSPPSSLDYYYTEVPYMLPSLYNSFYNLIYAVRPATVPDSRIMYDVGRAMAFRWILAEYISFENWLYLRIRQLQQDPSSSVLSRKFPSFTTQDTINGKPGKMLHERQYDQLHECIELMDHAKLDELKTQFKRRSRSQGLRRHVFEMQNTLVRRAIIYRVIEPHYTHILTHRHFWVY